MVRKMLRFGRFVLCYSGCVFWLSGVQRCIILNSRTRLVTLKSKTVKQVGIGGSGGVFSPRDLVKLGLFPILVLIYWYDFPFVIALFSGRRA